MNRNLFDEDKSELEIELDRLRDENFAMREFFDELSKPVIKRAIKKVEKQLRRFPSDACQFGDDSKLNFFEEVCVMQQEVSMDYYMFVEDGIESCCEAAYEELSIQEKFILNHQTIIPEKDGVEIIRDDFFRYANNYENIKIKDSLERRSLYDDYC